MQKVVFFKLSLSYPETMNTTYTLHTNREIFPREFGQIASLAHWGEPQTFTPDVVEAHFAAVDFVAHVRNSDNQLVGFTAAIFNGLSGVYIDSLLAHPEFDRDIIGSLLLNAVLGHFPNIPVYAMPFVDEQDVFRCAEFKVYRREMIALANRNDVPVATKMLADSN